MNTGFAQLGTRAVPNDWVVLPLRDVCRLINGRGFKPHEWRTTGLPIIRIQNLNGSVDFNYFMGAYDTKLEVARGQLLFAWSGSRGTSFGPHVWSGPLGLLNYHTWKVEAKESLVGTGFLFHALRGLTSMIEAAAHGAAALVHVQKWEMEVLSFAFPPSNAEQHAIAEALSDADALIESLERILAKKRLIKQGVMQELLTGKTRLPGFSGEWRVVLLGNLGEFRKGSGVTRSEAQSGPLPCVRYGEIYTRHEDLLREFFSSISFDVASRAALLRCGDVLFACSGETKAEIGKCVAFVGHLKAYAGGDIVIFHPRDADSRFLGYYLNSSAMQQQKAALGQGDAVVHISAASLARIECRIPAVGEQSAIATVLSDIDSELFALESKLTKARHIKTGMMQELLTGRIRLV